MDGVGMGFRARLVSRTVSPISKGYWALLDKIAHDASGAGSTGKHRADNPATFQHQHAMFIGWLFGVDQQKDFIAPPVSRGVNPVSHTEG